MTDKVVVKSSGAQNVGRENAGAMMSENERSNRSTGKCRTKNAGPVICVTRKRRHRCSHGWRLSVVP